MGWNGNSLCGEVIPIYFDFGQFSHPLQKHPRACSSLPSFTPVSLGARATGFPSDCSLFHGVRDLIHSRTHLATNVSSPQLIRLKRMATMSIDYDPTGDVKLILQELILQEQDNQNSTKSQPPPSKTGPPTRLVLSANLIIASFLAIYVFGPSTSPTHTRS